MKKKRTREKQESQRVSMGLGIEIGLLDVIAVVVPGAGSRLLLGKGALSTLSDPISTPGSVDVYEIFANICPGQCPRPIT